MSSLGRISAIIDKEVRQLSRDRITFGMVIMIPLIQLHSKYTYYIGAEHL